MAIVESSFGKNMIGDKGKSFGYYQIQLKLHKDVTMKCAMDLECSARWTLKRMKKNGYGKKPGTTDWFAISTHNSVTPSVNKKYAKMVQAALARQ